MVSTIHFSIRVLHWGFWSKVYFKIFYFLWSCCKFECSHDLFFRFWKVILYPATFLKLLVISRSHLVEFLRSLMYYVSSTNRDKLIFSLTICNSLFSALIIIAIVLCIVFKKGVRIEDISALLLIWVKMLQIFHHLGWSLVPVCHECHSSCWRLILLALLSPGLLSWGCTWDCVEDFLASI